MNSFVLLIDSFLIGRISDLLRNLPSGLFGKSAAASLSFQWLGMLKQQGKTMTVEGQAQKEVKLCRTFFRNAFLSLTLPVLTVGPGSISIAITPEQSASPPSPESFSRFFAACQSALLTLSIIFAYGFADRLAAIIGEKRDEYHPAASPSFLLVCIAPEDSLEWRESLASFSAP